MGENDQGDSGGTMRNGDPNDPSSTGIYKSQPDYTGEPTAPVAKKKSSIPLVLVGFILLAACAIVVMVMNRPNSKSASDDLGAGVFKAAGLKGHLVAQWTGKAQYQLHIEPLDPQQSADFAYVAGNPPAPLYVTIRLLDSSGFSVCGKDILLRFDPSKAAHPPISGPRRPANKAEAARIAQEQAARHADLQRQQAQEQERERGSDLFQNQLGADGQVEAIDAQGELPCSADQYKRVDYWDFTTNFPVLEEQEALRNHQKEKLEQLAREARLAAHRQNAKKFVSAFYIQGDDRVTGYDASRSLLGAGAGKSFFIERASDQTVAASWAADSPLIHYKCDQHGACALKHAGTATVIYGRLNE